MFGTRLAPVGQVPSCKHRRCWMDTQGSDCMPNSVSVHAMMLPPVPTWRSSPRVALVVVFLWETRAEGGGQAPAGKNASLTLFSRTPVFFCQRGKKYQQRSYRWWAVSAKVSASQCLLNSWQGRIDFGVFWISPSFCRLFFYLIHALLYISLGTTSANTLLHLILKIQSKVYHLWRRESWYKKKYHYLKSLPFL